RLARPTNAPATPRDPTPAAANLPGRGAGTPAAPVPALNPVTPLASLPAGTAAPDAARGPEALLTLTNEAVRFVFTSHGGGLKLAELLEYPAQVDCHLQGGDAAGTRAPLALNRLAPLPVLAFRNAALLEGNAEYALSRLPDGVRAERTNANGLRIVREFTLPPKPTTNHHLLRATVRIENRAASALQLPTQEWSAGSATPANRHDKGEIMGLDWYDGKSTSQAISWVSTPGLFCFPSRPAEEYTAGERNVVWAAVHNQFFTLITLPDAPAERVIARRVLLPAPTAAEMAADPRTVPQPVGAETVLVYPAVTINPGESLTRTFTLYAGPKEYFGLSRLQPEFDRVMGYGIFGFFAKPLLLGMNFLHYSLGLPYGWAIVVITLLIKSVFWPLTSVSTRSMKRMQELGPQLQVIREKYKDDPKKLNEKTLEFMRTSGYNPVAGCLPMLVQIPVFIGFFTMLRSAIELRGAGFLWCCDLSAADTLFAIPGLGWLPLLGVPGLGLPVNLMPLLYVGTALWQTHLTPPSPQMDPAQQKIFRWMPLMFLALFYNYSAGLTLYWTVQNLLSILQTKITKSNEPAAPATPARRPR
ncbi:MAG: membrane protein insertase YidC, partial [Verrucomicrobiota bacterium]